MDIERLRLTVKPLAMMAQRYKLCGIVTDLEYEPEQF